MHQFGDGSRGPTRRKVIGLAATGAVGAAAIGAGAAYELGWFDSEPTDPTLGAIPHPRTVPQPASGLGFLSGPPAAGTPSPSDLIARENTLPGRTYHIGSYQSPYKAGDDVGQQIKGYASATSLLPGERIAFHVHTATPQDVTIQIFRLGFYQGHGARVVLTSPALRGTPQPAPTAEPHSGMITCDWAPLWTLDVPKDWLSGVYLAVLSVTGFQNFVPFVVRDDERAAEFLVVLPFTTYQAYNQYPLDGKTGKSLYDGFKDGTKSGEVSYFTRSAKVSFHRPWSGSGWPAHFEDDADGVQFLEENGCDAVYATSLDLHSGRVDPRRYKAVVFTGHDEYWSWQMRQSVEAARDHGTHLAFLSANSVYWNIRVEQTADGRTDRAVVCYKDFHDPVRDTTPGKELLTRMWRDIGRPEQQFVGAQVGAQITGECPVRITGSGHWFWAGTGVKDGDTVPRVLFGEADQKVPGVTTPKNREYVVLAESPYIDHHNQKQTHNAVLYQAESGAWVFCSGTFGWNAGLSRPFYVDQRIRLATKNLLDKMRA